MKLDIICKKGRWLVNGKRLHELNHQERAFMNDFFREVRLSQIRESEEVEHFIHRQASNQEASINYLQLQKELA